MINLGNTDRCQPAWLSATPARSATAAGFVLGRKLDSIPFSAYHILIIAVLALVGFRIEPPVRSTSAFLFRPMLRTRLGDPLHKLRKPFPCVGMKLYFILHCTI